jgi:hypothetical protein
MIVGRAYLPDMGGLPSEGAFSTARGRARLPDLQTEELCRSVYSGLQPALADTGGAVPGPHRLFALWVLVVILTKSQRHQIVG